MVAEMDLKMNIRDYLGPCSTLNVSSKPRGLLQTQPVSVILSRQPLPTLDRDLGVVSAAMPSI